MLHTVRKFSSSPYAKVLLVIIVLPFIFWGMGPVFQGGKSNTIAEIGKENISTQEFIKFIEYNAANINDENLVEQLLYNFIGEKLIEEHIKNLNIKLSDSTLSFYIKNEKKFYKDNKFSRTEYEKFLIKNGLNAVSFETNMAKQLKKEQLFNFIGGGVYPANFLINKTFDEVNQKRKIKIINLNAIFDKKFIISENDIQSYFDKNKNSYKEIYRTIKFIKLNSKILTGTEEFSDLFFKKLDEIEDLIVEGKKIDFILKAYNLGAAKSKTFNKFGQNKKLVAIKELPSQIIKKTFNFIEDEPIVLIENGDEYFLIELTNTENVQKEISNSKVKNEISSLLKRQNIRKLISEIIDKINKNNFDKTDFDKFSKDESANIKEVKINGINDHQILKKDLIEQIYRYAEKKVIVVADIGFSETFLVYIDKIENVSIDKNSDNYNKYKNLSKINITNSLYKTYDGYLKNKYNVNINYKELNRVKNYFK